MTLRGPRYSYLPFLIREFSGIVVHDDEGVGILQPLYTRSDTISRYGFSRSVSRAQISLGEFKS